MAWSVPAVAVATAAPAHAVVSACEPELSYGDQACKCPGNSSPTDPKTYYLQFCVSDANCQGGYGGTFEVTAVVKSNGTNLTAAPNPCYPDILPTAPAAVNSCSTEILRYTSTNSSNKLDVTVKVTNNVGVVSTFVITVDTPPRDCAATVNCPKC